MRDPWNPSQYDKFKEERAKPFWDLCDLIKGQVFEQVIDLGCGTGALTRELHQRFKVSNTVGIDNSSAMLTEALKHKAPGLNFEQYEIQSFSNPKKFDLVFSNAALQWLPNHHELLPRVVGFLQDGGQLVIQVPANHEHVSHALARQIAGPKARATSVLTIEEYANLLHKIGFKEQIVRAQIYGHPMKSGRDILEWVKGTLLTEYQRVFSPAEYTEFYQEYERQLLKVVGEGPYFYAFKRILLWGQIS